MTMLVTRQRLEALEQRRQVLWPPPPFSGAPVSGSVIIDNVLQTITDIVYVTLSLTSDCW